MVGELEPRRRSSIWPIALVCFAIGCGVGFGAGLVTAKEGRGFVAGLFQKERRAATSSPKMVDRPHFHFEYAGNWTIDEADADYDPDRSFSVESPGQSFMMFQIADAALSPKALLDQHVEAQTSKLIKNAARAPFTKWGAFEGEGMILKGKLLGLTPGSVRIFCFRAGDQTVTVLEQSYDEDLARVQPGFELIERTFRWKER